MVYIESVYYGADQVIWKDGNYILLGKKDLHAVSAVTPKHSAVAEWVKTNEQVRIGNSQWTKSDAYIVETGWEGKHTTVVQIITHS